MATEDVITKLCRDCKVVKKFEEFSKQKRGYFGLMPMCKVCRSVERKKRYAEDAEFRNSILKSCKKYSANNAEYRRARAKEWKLKNPERARLKKKELNAKNKAKYNIPKMEWAKRNKDKVNAATARRWATKLKASVQWANKEKILNYFSEAKIKSKETGIRWHVDHIVPLRSKIVCGLHCEFNMQVITAEANKIKGNTYWPDMP